MNTIPCISLWQPWASLLVAGAKRVETRSWPTRHRGQLLVHAAKKWDRELIDLCRTEPFASALVPLVTDGTDPDPAEGLPLGFLVGSVEVADCFPTDRVRLVPDGTGVEWDKGVAHLLVDNAERAFGNYSPGRFAWLCRNPVRFATPVPLRGHQGMFGVPETAIPEEYR